MTIIEIIGSFLLLLGSIFLFLGGLGIFRMPDAYTRIQAGTKASTLGAMSVILSIGFFEPSWMLKMLIIIIFIAYSNPISSHALARAHYKRRHFPLILSDDKEQMDAYREIVPNENREDQL
jgi:multicomponent Na+:H+ antiporter subunit G